MPPTPGFAVACFLRSADDNFARALENHGLLDFYALGTRRGTKVVSPEHTRLQPLFGLLNYVAGRTLPVYQAESLRFRSFGLFDRWARSLLRPGHHLLTAYAFANGSMRWVQQHGGRAFLDAWTSHPEEFCNLLTEEQQRWGSRYPPVSRYYQDRAVDSVNVADYIFTSSTFVRQSFLKRGFDPERLLFCPYPVDLSLYRPASEPRPAQRPFTILHTGGLSLRKGAPYLLEAFRLIRNEVTNAVLRVRRHIRNDAVDILRRYADLPIEWSESLSLEGHVRRYQTSDLLLFPSVEDGFAQVVAEALACGLPVVTTPNTGAADLIHPGVNGEVAPIREPEALAHAALKWWERIRAGERIGGFEELKRRLSFQEFEAKFIGHLARLGIPS
ncbi:MAG: glycosyltransferase [Verrucomicrobia bacterium]|jgi:glycosyltransferase involved in cell wall biosynthesis|nr:glycosyltransferase [Verrucomicrobiota bacterium]